MITRACGIKPARAAGKLQALRIGAIGHGAGVDHVNVGHLVEFATLKPASPRRASIIAESYWLTLQPKVAIAKRIASASPIAPSMNPPPKTSSPR